jgi:hypothetical protein
MELWTETICSWSIPQSILLASRKRHMETMRQPPYIQCRENLDIHICLNSDLTAHIQYESTDDTCPSICNESDDSWVKLAIECRRWQNCLGEVVDEHIRHAATCNCGLLRVSLPYNQELLSQLTFNNSLFRLLRCCTQ